MTARYPIRYGRQDQAKSSKFSLKSYRILEVVGGINLTISSCEIIVRG